jgi:hypothetical protein
MQFNCAPTERNKNDATFGNGSKRKNRQQQKSMRGNGFDKKNLVGDYWIKVLEPVK